MLSGVDPCQPLRWVQPRAASPRRLEKDRQLDPSDADATADLVSMKRNRRFFVDNFQRGSLCFTFGLHRRFNLAHRNSSMAIGGISGKALRIAGEMAISGLERACWQSWDHFPAAQNSRRPMARMSRFAASRVARKRHPSPGLHRACAPLAAHSTEEMAEHGRAVASWKPAHSSTIFDRS